MKLTNVQSLAEHIVFINKSLPKLLHEVADFLEKDAIVWHIIFTCQRDSEDNFAAEVYRFKENK